MLRKNRPHRQQIRRIEAHLRLGQHIAGQRAHVANTLEIMKRLSATKDRTVPEQELIERLTERVLPEQCRALNTSQEILAHTEAKLP